MRKIFDSTAFFIAARYLFSKKQHNVINVISIVSMLGIMVSTAALVVVLSVFNGMSNTIGGWFNALHSDFEVTPATGKSFPVDSFPMSELAALPEVASVDEIVCDLSLSLYEDRQELLYLKGVSPAYFTTRGLDTLLIDGRPLFEKSGVDCAVMGTGAAGLLQVNLNDYEMLKIFYPKRNKKNFANSAESFNTRYLVPMGVICTNTNYDENYVFCDIGFVRDLMDYTGEVTSVEISLKTDADQKRCRKKIEYILGDEFVVKDKYEQEETLYRTMKSEKFVIYLILAFILILASFNIIGALVMLMIEKRGDVDVLYGMGAKYEQLKRVFLYEGMLVSAIGGLLGILFGAIVCFLQQTFHIVKLGGANGNYIIPYYPVQMSFLDMILVFITIILISALTSLIPVFQLKKLQIKGTSL